MRILRIIASIDPRQGGPVEGLMQSAALLSQWGHDTEVMSLDAPDIPAVKAAAFPVHALGPVARKYGYSWHVGQWMRTNARRFDAAVVHGLWNHASVGGGLGAARAGLPYVVFPHGMMDPWFRQVQPAKHLIKQLLWWGGQGQVLHRAHAVLFTSDQERLLAEGEFRGYGYHARTILYGAAAPGAAVKDGGAALRAALPGLGQAPYLLFLSRVHQKKGCNLLIDGLAAQAAKHPDLHLVIAGPDDSDLLPALLGQVEALGLAHRVHTAGMLRGAEKWGALSGAEAFILPSHQENFGIAVAEALACGTPVMISDKVNIWREIDATGAGFVAPDTVEGVSSLICRWRATAPAQRARMRRAALECYDRHFRMEPAAKALLDALQRASGA